MGGLNCNAARLPAASQVKIFAFPLLLAWTLVAGRVRGDDKTEAGKAAREVWKKCGGQEWANVAEVRFTFVQDQGGKTPIVAEHIWNVPAATDEVKWEGKRIKVNLTAPTTDDDTRVAYTRWVNDSNWLVAPLKLCDPRVALKSEGTKEIEGRKFQAIRLHFKNEEKPGHDYVLYIDESDALVRYWDYPSRDAAGRRSTWEAYRKFSGIMLSTLHRFGQTRIRLTDIQLTMAR